MKLIPLSTVLLAGAMAVAGSSAFADEMTIISVGDQVLPMRVAFIIYSRVDPGSTEEDFYDDNPELVGLTMADHLQPGATFNAPVQDREST
jgi:hypothetical protein